MSLGFFAVYSADVTNATITFVHPLPGHGIRPSLQRPWLPAEQSHERLVVLMRSSRENSIPQPKDQVEPPSECRQKSGSASRAAGGSGYASTGRPEGEGELLRLSLGDGERHLKYHARNLRLRARRIPVAPGPFG
jgi:hypothetical protein